MSYYSRKITTHTTIPSPPIPNTIANNSFLPALHHAISGAAGTAISTCLTYPLSLVVTRLQVQRQLARDGLLGTQADGEAGTYRGIGNAFSRILEEEGARALFGGLREDVAKSVLDSFLFFMFYEWFRSGRLSSRRSRGKEGLGVIEELGVGILAGACSRAVTTPIATIVTKKQTAALIEGAEAAEDLNIRQIAREIIQEKGIKGLWSGYSASLVLTLNPGITFFLQEYLKKGLLSREKWDDPGKGMTFLLAAVSKAVASAMTYPFQTAKARLQAGVDPEPEPEPEPASTREPQPNAEEQATAEGEKAAEAEGEKPVEGEGDKEAEPPAEAAAEPAAEEPAEPERDVHKEVEAKLNAARGAVSNLARQSIFGTIANIVRTEGVGALYDGVEGELLKGFFSHGTTMLAKGVVHKMLFRFYLGLAGVLRELRARTRARAQTRQQDSVEAAARSTEATVDHFRREQRFDQLPISYQRLAARGQDEQHPRYGRPANMSSVSGPSQNQGPSRFLPNVLSWGRGSNPGDDNDDGRFVYNMIDGTSRRVEKK